MNRVILLIIIGLQGCGPAYLLTEAYEATPYDAYKTGEKAVYVGVAPSSTTNNSLPFYYSNKRTEPYDLTLSIHSSKYDKGKLTLLSANISPQVGASYELIASNTERSCELSEASYNAQYTACTINVPFHEKLEYIENYRITVHVKFRVTGVPETQELKATFNSIRKEEKGSTFEIYMGV